LRSHKLAIMLTVSPSTTFHTIKEDALSALTSDVNQVEGILKVKSDNDFEICRAIKDKGKLTGAYEVMDVSKQVREYNLASWETLYLQFRNTATGKHFLSIIILSVLSSRPLRLLFEHIATSVQYPQHCNFNISGKLYPITFTQPCIDDEDEEPPEEEYPSSKSKGKRKAHPDDYD
jgi:hypothetical protein